MSAPPVVPPVFDHTRRSTFQEIKSKSMFSIFNIVAIVAILVIGYFLYKKFNDKFQKGAIRIPNITSKKVSPPSVEAADIEEEVPETPEKEE